jgi:hypothetical protein
VAPSLACVLAIALSAPSAFAQQSVPPANAPELAPDAKVEFATTPDEGQTTLPTPPPDAPPPRPRHSGLVLEQTLGVLGFAGQFGHVAPPAFWMHAQLGYEVLPWLMLFGEGELAFTDTGESQDESHSMAFPIWGFGGGLRGTVQVSSRVALFLQGDVGELTAYVPEGSLTDLGYHNAEALNVQLGARLGVEWHATDRHMALCLEGGARDATGFARTIGGGDFGLLWDSSAGFRYTF